MAFFINADGVVNPTFTIGGDNTAQNATIHTGTSTPAVANNNDIWINPNDGSIKVYNGSWLNPALDNIRISGGQISSTTGDITISPGGSGKLLYNGAEVITTGGSSPFTTDDLPEGSTNLYYLDSRARSSILNTGLNTTSSGGLATLSLAYNQGTGQFTLTKPLHIILGTDTSGDYVQTISQSTGITVSGGTGVGSTPTISVNNTVVRNDALQNITVAGTKTFEDARASTATPTQSLSFATKSYVDSVVSGLDVKKSVRAATTAAAGNRTLSGTQTIDDVALIAGDRVLIKDQTNKAENGIYVVDASTWSRAEDADSSGEFNSGMFVFVEEGTRNGSAGFVLSTPDPIIIGSTLVDFEQFSGAGQVEAGDGLSKNVNTLDVNTGTGIEISGDAVQIDNTVVATLGDAQDIAGAKTFTSPVTISTTTAGANLSVLSTQNSNYIDFGNSNTIGVDGSGNINMTNGTSAIYLGSQSGNANINGAQIITAGKTYTFDGTDISGNVSFDAVGNPTYTLTVADDSHNHIASNIDNFAEEVQDVVGGMLTGTQTNITVTYDDINNNLDFVVDASPTFTDLIVNGNLTVNGTTTSVNSNEVNIGDAIILLNSDETGTPSQNAGIEIERGTVSNVQFIWNETADRWSTNGQNLDAGTFIGALQGNADTATQLALSRQINGTSFNGSSDITTENWGTERDITIGSTTRSVNGSQNYSWTLGDIGAQPAGNYLLDTDDTFTGSLTVNGNIIMAGTGLVDGVDVSALATTVSGIDTAVPAIETTTGTDAVLNGPTAATIRTAIGAGTSSTTGTVTQVSAGNGLDFTTITGTGSVTLGTPGTLTATSTNNVSATSHTHAISGLTVAEFAGTAIQTGAEVFADSDTVLMTAAAVQDKIESYNYSTTVGDITAVTAGNGLTGGGTSGSVTVTMGTPASLNGSTTNNVTASSHTHEISLTASDVGAVPLSGASFIQSTGRSSTWGSTNGVSTGGLNTVMGTSTSATWLWSGTSAGTFRSGFQMLDIGGTGRLYTGTGTNYVQFQGRNISNVNTITANTFSGNASSASQVTVSNLETGDTNAPIVFVQDSTQGTKSLYEDSLFYYDTTNDELNVPNLRLYGDQEGLEFLGDANYFGTNLDARIIRMVDSNSTGGNVDGGLVFEGWTNNSGSGPEETKELLVMRTNGTFTWEGNEIWHAGNDGASSGLDADLLDAQQGSYYLDYNNFTNTPAINNGTVAIAAGDDILLTGGDYNFSMNQSNSQTITINHATMGSQSSVNNSNGTVIQDVTLDNGHVTELNSVNLDDRYPRKIATAPNNINTRIDSGLYENSTATTAEGWPINSDWMNLLAITHSNTSNYYSMQLASDFDNQDLWFRQTAAGTTTTSQSWAQVWTSATDGASSGLDADLLDGNHGSYYRNANNLNAGTVASARLPEATSTARGAIELFSDTDQSVAANAVSATAGRTYGIQLNSAGQAVVNVPWTDTNTNTTNFNVQANGGTQVNISAGEEINFINGTDTTAVVVDQTNPTVQFNVSSTDANTASTIVKRNASGNFSAGTITANLTGVASQVTVSNHIANDTEYPIVWHNNSNSLFDSTNGVTYNPLNTRLTAPRLTVDTGTTQQISMFTESGSAQIADTFAAVTNKSYINFSAGSGSSDPGFIMHETSGTEINEGVLHLCPSDDNSYGDYVSIHGSNDPDVIKLHTSGVVEGITTLYATSSVLPASDNTGVVGNASFTWNNGQFTNLTIDSTINVRGAVDLADNDFVRWGSDDDIATFWNGSNFYLDFQTTDSNMFIRNVANANVFTFNVGTGELTAGSYNTTSDRRLKSDIEDYVVAGISDIKAKTFTLNADESGRLRIGYIAQEVAEVLPSAVNENEDGFLSVNYDEVHTAKIAELEAEVADLKQIAKNQAEQIEKLFEIVDRYTDGL